jgi:hypothetical protein
LAADAVLLFKSVSDRKMASANRREERETAKFDALCAGSGCPHLVPDQAGLIAQERASGMPKTAAIQWTRAGRIWLLAEL